MSSLVARRRGGFVLLTLAILGAGWGFVSPVMPVLAAGTAYVVTTTDDTPTDAICAVTCTLRQAVNASNAHDPGAGNQNTITFANGVSGTIAANTHGTLTLSTSVAIAGPTSGAGVTVSGGNAIQVLAVNIGGTASVSNLTIANGNSSTGGGIYNGGTLTVTNSTLTGNSAPSSLGGGIFNDTGATLTVTNSTFSGNSATNNGGGIFNNTGTLNLTNTTFSGNSANNNGGGITNFGTLNLTNTILSGNTATFGGDLFGAAPAINNHNLIGGTPLLGPLANNGGTTQTFALLSGSPAIGAGDATVCASTTVPAGAAVSGKDQRGRPRPATVCSQGAYEAIQTYTVGTTSDSVAAATLAQCLDGANTACRLRDAIGFATGASDTIGFNSTGRGTITLGSTLILGTNVTLAGPTSGVGVTVSGGGAVRVFSVNSGVTANLRNLTIANGNSGGGNGGGIINTGTLTLTNCTFSGNTAPGGGGGGIFNGGGSTLTVTNSTFSGNTATTSGGGIFNGAGTLHLTNTIVAGNSAPTGPDVTGTVTTTGHNLLGTISGTTGITNGMNGDIVNPTPLLGALSNNGGTTQTIPLLTGSPAIAHGDPAACAATPISGLDQRGVIRPTILCAIGAFEPLLSAISPAAGSTNGLAPVTLTGAGFAAGATVTIGTVPCGNIVVVNGETLTCTTGAHVAGAVDVVVTVGSATGTLAGGYTYGVVNPLPPPQPPGPTGGAPNPLPGSRPSGPTGGPAPNPLPVPRP